MNSRRFTNQERLRDTVGLRANPAARFFDLMEQVDPLASRFEVEELITLENKDASTLFKEKWSMSYLAQNGVFG
jgi:hypothetical protein